jgi:hypothetical protein
MKFVSPAPFILPSLEDYNYIKFLTRSRIAWEYLRRNPMYRCEWKASHPGRCRPIHIIDGTVLLRLRRRFQRAEAWGLYSFRQSGLNGD